MKTHIAGPRQSFVRDESGAALVEFAFIAMMMLVMVFGIIDFGRIMYSQNALTNAAREGGRYAAVLGPTPEGFVDNIKDTVVAHMAPLGNDSLTAAEVSVVFNYAGAGVLQSTTVNISHSYNALTPIWRLLSSDSVLTLHASAQFRCEACGG